MEPPVFPPAKAASILFKEPLVWMHDLPRCNLSLEHILLSMATATSDRAGEDEEEKYTEESLAQHGDDQGSPPSTSQLPTTHRPNTATIPHRNLNTPT